MFTVFQLTALVSHDPATRGERFIVNLVRVAVKEEEMRGVLLCVQDIVRSPQFSQKSFFSDSGWTMLSESVAIANFVTPSPVYAPWSIAETACGGQVVSDLRACWDRVVLRRRTAKDTSERFYHGGTPRSETPSRPGMQNSDVVAEGRVEYVPVASPALGPPGPSKIRSSPSNRKSKISQSPLKLPRNLNLPVLQLVPRSDPW